MLLLFTHPRSKQCPLSPNTLIDTETKISSQTSTVGISRRGPLSSAETRLGGCAQQYVAFTTSIPALILVLRLLGDAAVV